MATKKEQVLLTAAEILAFDDLEHEDILVKAWGGRPVRLRTMTAEEAIVFTKAIEGNKRSDAVVRIVAACAIGSDGSPLFPDEESIKALGKKSLKAFMELQEAAVRLNGLGKEDEDEEVKND